MLPAFHLPLTTAVFNISTKLPGGRSQLFHHAFPILTAPPGPDAKPQEVIDVFSMMKCEGWSLGIDIAVNSDRTPSVGNIPGAGGRSTGIGAGIGAAAAAGLGGAGPAGVAAACWHYYQPYNLPHAFIGEFQMKYIIDAVDTLVNPSAVVRLSRKLKPFYVRDRSAAAAAAAKAVAAVRAQIVAMPLLKQQVEIALTADVFRVHHDAQDAEDPSDMVYIALSRWGCGKGVAGVAQFAWCEQMPVQKRVGCGCGACTLLVLFRECGAGTLCVAAELGCTPCIAAVPAAVLGDRVVV